LEDKKGDLRKQESQNSHFSPAGRLDKGTKRGQEEGKVREERKSRGRELSVKGNEGKKGKKGEITSEKWYRFCGKATRNTKEARQENMDCRWDYRPQLA